MSYGMYRHESMIKLEPLTRDELYKVHVSALEVLERTGVQIYEDEALRLLQDAGCDVDLGSRRVKIPQHLVKEAVSKAPSIVCLCGRDKNHDMKLGCGRLYIRSSGGVPYFLDMETQQRREGTKKEVAECTRVLDSLANIHSLLTPLFVPTDVPSKTMEVHGAEVALNNTVKHVVTEIFSKERIRDVLDMGVAVAGSEQELRRRPVISCLTQPVAPLQHNELQTRILIEFAKLGLPLTIKSHPLSGLSSPVTLAGELVMTVAEILSSLTIAQLVNPKTPTIFGMSSSTVDMRAGINLSGAVEVGLLYAGVVQMARYYNIPSSGTSGIDSPLPDAQASIERIMTAMPEIMAGVDDIWLAANDLKHTFSLEQLLIDDAICANIGRLLAGIEVTDETLAVDLIDEVGPGGNFLTKRHTQAHYRKEHLIPAIYTRSTWDDWEKAGRKDICQRAREKAREIIRTHQPPPLDKDIQNRLAEISKKADRAVA